ncbi:hypothetical protein SAV31267_015070 [Streptomyces avermitilis]|uniref:4'-phosphopantetheinyl transferase domain-containing protein n=1 Tax=Streptomyces avermitilis TaxID=33903 RepID=A0A4D4MIX5_STRAX|nr:hypothetical protein SAV31267_015070 [Streptomyces avermitilis]
MTDRPEGTLAVALAPPERELLRALAQAPRGAPERLWFTRFWAAKEAVAKARGTGLGGAPKQFEITAADGAVVSVRVAGEEYRVRHSSLTIPRPSGQPGKEYVVAWTAVNDSGERR